MVRSLFVDRTGAVDGRAISNEPDTNAGEEEMAEQVSDVERNHALEEKVAEYQSQGYRITDRKPDRVELVKEYHSVLLTVEEDGTVNVAG
jgi:hypothetical protein